MFANSWEQTSLLWAFLLDGLRYMIVFNPAIVFVMQYVLAHTFSFEETVVNV